MKARNRAPTRPHLRSLSLKQELSEQRQFPFNVAAIRTLPRIELSAPVTFFVGANGSGKSTLLEALAAAARLPTIGADDIDRDETLVQQRRLSEALQLTWTQRAHRGFFLRAEDFFGFARRISRTRSELQERLRDVSRDYADASDFARGLAGGPARSSLAAMERLYGDGLDARSHGEAFLRLFEARLAPDGLYLLDEPEAALSPHSQLAFMAMMAEAIEARSQFIIATHSPILLAYPGALLLSFDVAPIERVTFEELEHVALTRDFLNHPERYLRRLLPDPLQADWPSSTGSDET